MTDDGFEIPDTADPEPSELIRLAASGIDIDGIARRLGMRRDVAARRLAHESAELRKMLPDTEGDRLIERAHLDLLRRALMPAALNGDLVATRLLVRIHQARALLLGLLNDAPPMIEAEPDGEVSELDRIRARRAARRSAEAQ